MLSGVYYCALMCVTAATTVLRAFAAEGAATSARIMNFGVTGASIVSGPSHYNCFHRGIAFSRDNHGDYLSLPYRYQPILRVG